MKKPILAASLLTSLLVAGCGTTENAFKKFSSIIDNAQPLVQEAEEWEAYSVSAIEKGVVYGTANATDKQFVSKKMDAEYAASIDRLARPLALTKAMKAELDQDFKYTFKYNQIMPVKDKKTSATLGYCTNFDVTVFKNGKATPPDSAGNVTKSFLYVAKDKPISATTANATFTKRMCGDSFYTKYKNPNV